MPIQDPHRRDPIPVSSNHPNPAFHPTSPDIAAASLNHHPHHFTSDLPISPNVIVAASPATPVLNHSTHTSNTLPFAPHPTLALPDSNPTPTHSKWRVTPAQKDVLTKAFDEQPYPELRRKVDLAEQLGVTTAQISKWFQHRRESLTRLGQFKAQYNRTRRTPEQLDVLQSAFEEDRYPTAEKLAQLESQLAGVTVKQIKLWFKHRRKQVQKRNRANASPRPGMGHSGTTVPSHMLTNAPRQLPHDPSNSSPSDVFRTDWRTGPSAPLTTALTQPNVGATMSAMPTPQQQAVAAQSLVQNPVAPTAAMQYAFDPHYYPYKAQPLMLAHHMQTQLSELDIMALRGAQAVTNAKPSPEGIFRLSQLLNRSHTTLEEWFRSQSPSRATTEVLTDTAHQQLVQSSPTMLDPSASRPYSTASTVQASPVLADYRAKMETDVQMTQTSGKTANVNSSSSKATSVREHEMERSQIDTKQSSDASSSARATVQGKETSSHPTVNQMSSVAMSTYEQPPLLDAASDCNATQQHTAGYPAAQTTSAPVLAPLRYMPSNPPGPAYIHPNTVWYHPSQAFPK